MLTLFSRNPAKLLIFSILILTSCSSSSSPEPDLDGAKEIKAKTKTSLDLPELELFSSAKRQYQASLYSVARDSFTAIKDSYPTGPFAEFAELKIADTYFENRDYINAASSYEEFSKNRPASSALAYSLLRAGKSYELSSAGVGRDPTPLFKAQELYTSLINKFPTSVYAPAANFYKRGVEELLASYEQQVISFYDKNEKENAARMREKQFQKKYGEGSDQFLAADYDKKAAIAVGPISEDKILKAKAFLKSLPPLSASRANYQELENERSVIPEGKFNINSVSCDPAEKLIVLSLDPKPATPPSNLLAIKKGDSIELKIENLTTIGEETRAYSCFSEGDMTISSSGLLTLRALTSSATALYVDNPSRIILTLKDEE